MTSSMHTSIDTIELQSNCAHPSAKDLRTRLKSDGHEALAHDCRPAGEILARVGDKWSVLVLMLLGDGPMRFNELRRMIGVISQRMLTLTLRGLERDGFVARTVSPTVPPRVDYALTELGQSLRTPIRALGEWAFTNVEHVAAARRRFDERESNRKAAED